MKKQHQIVFEKGKGDCWRTCIACILDLNLEEVPNFAAETKDGVSQFFAGRDWLEARGVALEVYGSHAPPAGVLYIGSGMSSRGTRHACVCQDSEVIWDPHPSGVGLAEIEHAEVLAVIARE